MTLQNIYNEKKKELEAEMNLLKIGKGNGIKFFRLDREIMFLFSIASKLEIPLDT